MQVNPMYLISNYSKKCNETNAVHTSSNAPGGRLKLTALTPSDPVSCIADINF